MDWSFGAGFPAQMYMWPGAEWLGVVPYGFDGVSSNAECLSIPLLLLHLTRSGMEWKVKERLIPDSHGHTSFQGIRLMRPR